MSGKSIRLRKVLWDDEAKKSLRSIYEYLKHHESILTARKVRNGIVEQTKKLELFPEKFAREPVLTDEQGNFRYKVIWSYKIIYEITPTAILVIDIFHTSRNPTEINKKETD